MPRIHPRDIIRARAASKALFALLPVCRDLPSARHELRWLREHAIAVSQQTGWQDNLSILSSLVSRRASGEPLQYVLGSEFFGDLEAKVRPGVLIPRPETAASVSHLARLMVERRKACSPEPQNLRILDVCTGTGCIPLLLHHEYYAATETGEDHLEILGVDISSHALSLARENLIHQIATQSKGSTSTSKGRTRSLNSIGFVQADVMVADLPPSQDAVGTLDHARPLPLLEALQRLHTNASKPTFNLLTANPPYISPESFKRTTSRSVRNFEPLQALVPTSSGSQGCDTDIGDSFYPRLLRIAEDVNAEAFLFEVADMDQAIRVVIRAIARGAWEKLEIWRDEPSINSSETHVQIDKHQIRIRGAGNGRSVFGWRPGGAAFLAL